VDDALPIVDVLTDACATPDARDEETALRNLKHVARARLERAAQLTSNVKG